MDTFYSARNVSRGPNKQIRIISDGSCGSCYLKAHSEAFHYTV